jgi:hypothetical protein
MGIFRCTQDELVAFEYKNKAGITFGDGGNEFDNTLKHFAERVGCRHPRAKFMQKIKRRVFVFVLKDFPGAFRSFFDQKAHARMTGLQIRLQSERA